MRKKKLKQSMAILLSAAMLVPNTGGSTVYAATDEVVDKVTLETELDSTKEEKESLEENAEPESSEDGAESSETEPESLEDNAEPESESLPGNKELEEEI